MADRSFHCRWSGWETIPEVRNWSGDPPGGPEVVGRPSVGPELVGRSLHSNVSSRKALPEVWIWSGGPPGVQNWSGDPPGGPGVVGTSFHSLWSGWQTLNGGPVVVWIPSRRSEIAWEVLPQ